jgi:hypothetical protein
MKKPDPIHVFMNRLVAVATPIITAAWILMAWDLLLSEAMR